MSGYICTAAGLVCLMALAGGDPAGDGPKSRLATQTVTLSTETLPLSEALDQVRRQTGNVVHDTRQQRTDPPL